MVYRAVLSYSVGMTALTPPQRKRVENEAIFRELNQRIKKNVSRLLAESDQDKFDVKFICECSDPECFETIDITVPEFEKIHSNSRRFVIKKGHQHSDIEDVRHKGKKYAIVEKTVAPG